MYPVSVYVREERIRYHVHHEYQFHSYIQKTKKAPISQVWEIKSSFKKNKPYLSPFPEAHTLFIFKI